MAKKRVEQRVEFLDMSPPGCDSGSKGPLSGGETPPPYNPGAKTTESGIPQPSQVLGAGGGGGAVGAALGEHGEEESG
jgi:hypothetical protein